jgi:hypothetical protein
LPDWFDIRRQARRDIHAAFSVEARYSDSVAVDPVTLHARWLYRFGVPIGDIPGGDYAQIYDSIDRVVFDADELTEKNLVIRHGGQITFVKYGYTFTIDVRQPDTGPVTQTWTVSK